MCEHVHMYVRVWCLCVYVSMYICTYVCLCLFVYMYVCMHVYLCVCVHIGGEGMEEGSAGDRNINTAASPVRGLFFSFLFLGVM